RPAAAGRRRFLGDGAGAGGGLGEMSAAALALRHGRALLFISAAAAAGGLWAAARMPKGVYPEVTFPREQVVGQLAGAPAATELVAERVLPSSFPILSLNVEGPYPPEKLYEIAQYTLRPALSGLPGVGLVTVQSSDVPETQVLLDPARLVAAHLSVPQVADKIR